MANENETLDFTGRIIVVTGANSGIGLAAATRFARCGARVVLTGRDGARLDEALATVRAVAGADAAPAAYRADFARFADVRRLAGELSEAYPHIDVLCNNAGGLVGRQTTTVDGHEMTIQVNHLSPFLLTMLLRERLAGGRVVNTASDAHRAGRLDPAHIDQVGQYRGMRVYGSSKQANILFAAEAARRWPEIVSTSYHPGVVRTRFGRDSAVMQAFYRFSPLLATPEQGADTMVWLAGAPASDIENGAYYVKRARREPSAPTRDPGAAATLWESSLAAVSG